MPQANVLLVDDDPDVLAVLAGWLRAAGLSVETARSGAKALERLEAARPELIIADVKMPGMDGYELCRAVRSGGHDDLPFLFCSALDTPPARIAGLRVGADDYLGKPSDPEELLLRVRTLLRRGRRLRSFRQQAQSKSATALLRGSLGEIWVADLFQIIDFFGLQDVHLELVRPDGRTGGIYVGEKELLHAACDGIAGRKAFFRMLAWREGTFSIAHRRRPAAPNMAQRVDQCVMEGVARLDECRQLRAHLGLEGRLQARSPATSSLEAPVAGVLALVREHRDLERVLERSPLEDLETLQILAQLVESGAVAPAPLG